MEDICTFKSPLARQLRKDVIAQNFCRDTPETPPYTRNTGSSDTRLTPYSIFQSVKRRPFLVDHRPPSTPSTFSFTQLIQQRKAVGLVSPPPTTSLEDDLAALNVTSEEFADKTIEDTYLKVTENQAGLDQLLHTLRSKVLALAPEFALPIRNIKEEDMLLPSMSTDKNPSPEILLKRMRDLQAQGAELTDEIEVQISALATLNNERKVLPKEQQLSPAASERLNELHELQEIGNRLVQ